MVGRGCKSDDLPSLLFNERKSAEISVPNFPNSPSDCQRRSMFKEEGYKLMGAAFEVYNQLGYGMAEEIYQESFEIELSLRGIPFHTKRDLRVFYTGQLLDTIYRPDLLAWNEIVVELKAVTQLVTDHTAQL